MRRAETILRICLLILSGLVGIHFLGSEALAAEETAGWRPVFDLVMRWLNFGIIVFVLVKFGKTPIRNFLLSRREEVAQEIRKVEEEKEKIDEKIQAATRKMDESEERINKIKERIIREGEKKKQQIIKEAHRESEILLEGTKKRIENQLLEAKKALKSDLVDAAVSLAIKRLPDEITAEDDQKMINQFLVGASAD